MCHLLHVLQLVVLMMGNVAGSDVLCLMPVPPPPTHPTTHPPNHPTTQPNPTQPPSPPASATTLYGAAHMLTCHMILTWPGCCRSFMSQRLPQEEAVQQEQHALALLQQEGQQLRAGCAAGGQQALLAGVAAGVRALEKLVAEAAAAEPMQVCWGSWS